MKRLLGLAACLAALMAGAAVAQDTTLRFANIFGSERGKLWEPVIADFEAANPGVKVVMEVTAGSGSAVYPDVLRTAMQSGDPPDLFFMWGGATAAPYTSAGQAKELTAYYDQYGWNDRFPAWGIDSLKVGDGIYGVPYNGRGMGFWYRKDILEANGLTLPTTFAEFETMCDTLKTKANVGCISIGGKFGWHTMRVTDYFLEAACGPAVHDAILATTETWNQPCVVDAYARMKKWIDNGWILPDFLNIAPEDARFPVFMGNALMILEGQWHEGTLKDDDQDAANWDFFLPPTDHEPLRYSAFTEIWMISEGAKNPDLAAKFIDFISQPETVNKYPKAFNSSAVIGFQPNCDETPFECRWADILQGDTKTYWPTDGVFLKELADAFFEVQDGIIAGKFTPEEGAATMQERVDAFKAKA